MPPNRHSSSSHSSRPSSSRSSSSRSSGSSSRGPSRHSASSYSSKSAYTSKSSFSGGRASGGPSGHASTSHHGESAAAKPRQNTDWRPRVNQPTGFVAAAHMRPTYYNGSRHSYAYYPTSWTDRDTGVSYEKGYYDENGRRYDHVSFAENGSYKNVLCHCPYCGQDTLLDLGVGDAAHSLKCPHCGGPMEIRSELDAIERGAAENTHVYRSEESLKNAFPKKKRKNRLWLIAVLLLLLAGIGKAVVDRPAQNSLPLPDTQIQQIDALPYGENVYLEKQADGAYHIVTDVLRADKILTFDREAESYCDESSDCWLWYNTEMEPPVWQYWYEGISADYGEYGWMEHEPEGWFIEEAEGKWRPLPAKYDTSGLWWIGS